MYRGSNRGRQWPRRRWKTDCLADILVHNWEFGKPAALDFTITSPQYDSTLNEASVMSGSAASAAEFRKLATNDEKSNRTRLGWVCIPLSVETYTVAGERKPAGVSTDSLHVSPTRIACPKYSAVSGLYGRLSIALVRANARNFWLDRHHLYNDYLCPR